MECSCCSYGLLFVLGTVVLCYYYVKRKYDYFEDCGLKYLAPSFPFGNLKGAGTKIHIALISKKIYDHFVGKDVVCGFFFFIEPAIMILDPEVIKHVLVKDFNYFHDRGIYFNEIDDPISANMFALEGHKWKNLRSKLTPTFTSGKMKMMFDVVQRCAEELDKYLQPIADNNEEIEIKDVLSRFSTDVIGNCAFGIDCNSLKNPDAEFRHYGRRVFEPPSIQQLKLLFALSFKSLARKLGVRVVEKQTSDFFMRVVRETLKYRKNNVVNRNDFFKMIMEMQSEDDISSSDKLNFNEIAAQCFLFFLAGFETSASTMSYCLLELAKNSEIQDKVRADINKITKKYDGNVTYESLLEMDYLDNAINETLRKFPAQDVLVRTAGDDYKVPNSNHVIKKGQMITIPVYGMHMNPKIYPDPEKFDPDRFLVENRTVRHPFTFLPFGEGPRNCIGMRFGLMQTRLGLVYVLRKYRVTVCEKTAMTVEFLPNTPILALKNGTWIRLQKL